jgi:hypothetical protein
LEEKALAKLQLVHAVATVTSAHTISEALTTFSPRAVVVSPMESGVCV